MYRVHVPAAWITLGIFSAITLLSILGYITKLKNFFLIAKSLAPSGFVFNIIALLLVQFGVNQLGGLGGHGMRG